MTTLTNTFEGIGSGITLTAGAGGNTGGASGNFFDTITIGTNATLAADNTHSAHGIVSCKVATAASSVTSFAQWDTSMGTQAQIWFRSYLYFTANPGSATDVIEGASVGGLCAGVQLATNGTLIFRNSAGTTIFTTTATIPLNQWFRLEGFIIGSSTVGQVSLSLYKTADSLTPDETDTSAATQNTRGSMTQYRFGQLTARVNAGPFWQDDLGISSTGPLGPAASLAPPQQITIPRRVPARAYVQGSPAATAAAAVFVAVSAPTQQPRPSPGRPRARAYIQFTPVRTTNATAATSTPPTQQPGPARRRTPARAYIQFTPVRTTNAAPVVIPAGPPPVIPTSGGDRSPTIRVFREIKPGDVPTSGAQLPKLTGRAFAMPVAADVEHVTHAWDETVEDETPVPSGPSLLDQARTELDELAKAARDAADAIDRAADRARPIVEGIGSKAYDLGKIFGTQPYDPRPRKVCGATRMSGGIVLTCQRKPHDDGWHSDKGLHWR